MPRQIFSAVELLPKHQAGYLAEDLKDIFDKAVSKARGQNLGAGADLSPGAVVQKTSKHAMKTLSVTHSLAPL